MQNVVFDQESDEERHPRPEYSDSTKVPEEGQNEARALRNVTLLGVDLRKSVPELVSSISG